MIMAIPLRDIRNRVLLEDAPPVGSTWSEKVCGY
jgi:hypothetical protein